MGDSKQKIVLKKIMPSQRSGPCHIPDDKGPSPRFCTYLRPRFSAKAWWLIGVSDRWQGKSVGKGGNYRQDSWENVEMPVRIQVGRFYAVIAEPLDLAGKFNLNRRSDSTPQTGNGKASGGKTEFAITIQQRQYFVGWGKGFAIYEIKMQPNTQRRQFFGNPHGLGGGRHICHNRRTGEQAGGVSVLDSSVYTAAETEIVRIHYESQCHSGRV
jgi:hypothetical protein